MQISDLTQQYTNTTSSAESLSGTRGVEQLVSYVRNLTVGNIFEGTINSIKGNQVLLGLSNGTELAARVEADMQLVQGQSMFFQVKANDGATIAIRPYTVDGAGANLTLLHALQAANLPVQDKYLNMANTMMQEQMPIDKNSMGQMARILMNHPDVNVQTLVQMKKLDMPITTEMVAQFENYTDDKSAVHMALDKFISELPTIFTSQNMPLEQMKAFDSQFLMILAEDGETQTPMQQEAVTTEGILPESNLQGEIPPEGVKQVENLQNNVTQEGAKQVENLQKNVTQEGVVQERTVIEGNAAQESVVQENKTQDVNAQVTVEAKGKEQAILQKLANHIATGEHISKESLLELFSSKDMQNLMKQVVEEQFFIKPKDLEDGEKLKKLYDRLEAKTQKLETLLQNAGLKETPLAQTLSDIHANVEFMNQLNQAYTYTQIPLKMANQNASGQLYVYTNKRNLEDPDRDLTAFLHLDLEHLGATDVSVRMHRKEVSTKFYMDSDAAYELVKAYMPQLEERLRAKGYNCRIEVANEGRHVNFVEDFLKKDAPSTGMLHRYSFDVRA